MKDLSSRCTNTHNPIIVVSELGLFCIKISSVAYLIAFQEFEFIVSVHFMALA